MSDVPSWLDNWPTIKTFGPSMITGSVTALMASLAYFVSRAQREIAANKYNLDLFDKRYPIYEEFDKCFSILKNVKSEKTFCEKRTNISESKDTIIKCSRLFSGVSEYCYTLITLPDSLNSKREERNTLKESTIKNEKYFKYKQNIYNEISSLRREFNDLKNNNQQHAEISRGDIINELTELERILENYEYELEIYESNKKMK